jgi:outer membrane protein
VGFSTLKSSTSSNLNANFSQPLLRNRGSYLTKLPISIARSRLRASEYSLQNQVLQLVSNAENAYWDVVLARENVKVQEQALALADTSLKRAQRELELGAISPLDIYQPQAQFANYQIQVSQARYRLQQVEDVLRKQMGADLDPAIRRLPVVLTEPIDPPADVPMDREAIVQRAVNFRPDVKAARQNIDIDDLNIKSATNGLRPDFRLTGQYGATGRGGPFTQRQNVFTGDGTTSTVISTVPGGFGDALDQLFGFGFPVYGFGLTLTLPIRDRRAAADYADAVVTKRLDALRVRSAEQTVRLDVLNAISLVEGSKANIELAKIALDLAQKRVDAEQKKYDLGTSTLFFLLDAQAALNQAQSALVNQSVNHRKNLTNLLRFTGELLPERGIAIQ